MVKVRLWGELEEVNKLAELISGLSPHIRILSCSKNYADRGASVYNRVYMDVELHAAAKVNQDFENSLAPATVQTRRKRLKGGVE